MVKLVDIAQVNPKLDRSEIFELGEHVSFIPMSHVSEEHGSITQEEVRPLCEVMKGFTAFRDRDVLVAKITPCFENGKIAHARIKKRLGFGSTEFHVIRPNRSVLDDRYLFHFLRQPAIRTQGERRMTGSAGQKRVPKAFIETLELRLPELTEQRRIAAVLDKADALRTRRHVAILKLNQLLRSVFLDMFGDPATNPKKLQLAQLGELGEWQSGGTPSRTVPSYFEGDIPWYSSGELNNIYIGDSSEHISDSAIRHSAARLMLPGTLMVGMYDTAAFKSSITTMRSTCNQAIAFSLLDCEKTETLYIYHALQVGKDHYKRLQRGVRQKNLNLSMIRSTEVPLPEMSQQKRFVRIAERIEHQKRSMQRHANQLDTLFASLQHRAFAGTL